MEIKPETQKIIWKEFEQRPSSPIKACKIKFCTVFITLYAQFLQRMNNKKLYIYARTKTLYNHTNISVWKWKKTTVTLNTAAEKITAR